MAFDVAGSVPPEASVQSVTLSLEMSRAKVGPMTFDLHRLTADWGEGMSDAGGQEGDGTGAEMGDVTWRHTFYDTSEWATLGGDFDSTVSASAVGWRRRSRGSL